MARLARARLLVALIPFDRWRRSLGAAAARREIDGAEADRLAAHVEWASRLLPFRTKCLHRAMALSWALRRAGIDHSVVIAVRPPRSRGADDDLHAWVEVDGAIVLGELPGPWIETLRIGH